MLNTSRCPNHLWGHMSINDNPKLTLTLTVNLTLLSPASILYTSSSHIIYKIPHAASMLQNENNSQTALAAISRTAFSGGSQVGNTGCSK